MRKTFMMMAVLLACAVPTAAQLKMSGPKNHGMDPAKLAQVDRVIEAAIAQKTIPGAVISIVRGDEIVYLKAYGHKSLVPTVEPMTTETMFDLASVSKCVGTTLSFLQLIENGYVRLIDPVARYIPGFRPWKNPDGDETVDITVRDLLTHSSGLSPYIGVNAYVQEYGENSPDSLERYIATRVPRNFRPGTDLMYSCLNFITLQRILERVTGEKLYEYAQKHVFDVLGLKHTCYFPLVDPPAVPDEGRLARLCAPTEVQADGLPLTAKVHDPIARRVMGGSSGNAGVFSNAEDLSVICAAIMGNGSLFSKKASDGTGRLRLLSPAMIRVMATIPPENDPSIERALGWDKSQTGPGTRGDLFDPKNTLAHTGYTGTSIVIDQKTRTAVILLTHRVHPHDEGSLARLRALVSNIVAGSILY